MARCTICDYCDTIGQSTYNDYSGYRSDGSGDRGGNVSLETLLGAGHDPEKFGTTKIWEHMVWEDRMGELCSRCRKEIEQVLYGYEYLDNKSESGYNLSRIETEDHSAIMETEDLEEFIEREFY